MNFGSIGPFPTWPPSSGATCSITVPPGMQLVPPCSLVPIENDPRRGWLPGTSRPPVNPGMTELKNGMVYCKGTPYGPGMTLPAECAELLFPGQHQTPQGWVPNVTAAPKPASISITPREEKSSLLPFVAIGAAAYFLLG